jgi:hypothetical protein
MSIKNLKPNMKGKFKQGYFPVQYPDKYLGDPRQIIARSSWEAKFMNWCDNHPSVVKWSSEPVAIPYISPIDNKEHKYYVDFYLKVQKNGVAEDWLIEIKPDSQTKKPSEKLLEGSRTLKKIQQYNWQLRTYIINCAKFAAAQQFAAARGMRFGVAGENFLF